MKRKPVAKRNIGIDMNAAAIAQFLRDYAVELVHEHLAEFQIRPLQPQSLWHSLAPESETHRKGKRVRLGDQDAAAA